MLTGCNPQITRSLPHQEPSMIPTDNTAFGMALIAINRLEDLFTLCWTFFTFTLFTIAAAAATTAAAAAVTAAAAAASATSRKIIQPPAALGMWK